MKEDIKSTLKETIDSFGEKEKNKLNDILQDENSLILKLALARLYKNNNEDIFFDLYKEHKNKNKYLYTASMSPREFGEDWAEMQIVNGNPLLKKSEASEYDIDDIATNKKIEVKATRVAKKNQKKEKLSLKDRMKSLSESDDSKDKLNFEQVKPYCCDVFILMAVYTDDMRFWVIPSEKIKNGEIKMARQHRGGDGTEGQLWLTPEKYSEYECNIDEITEKIQSYEI